MKTYKLILVLLICYSKYAAAQYVNRNDFLMSDTGNIIRTDSGVIVLTFSRIVCKNKFVLRQYFFSYQKCISEPMIIVPIIPSVPNKSKYLNIHGNISYDLFYRSRIDTPINQQNFQQHTERLYLDIILKEKYPLKVNFTARQSNSPYFRDFVDVNLNFDRYAFNKNLKQELLDKLKAQSSQYKFPDLASAEAALKKKQEELENIKNWVENPATLQKLVEEKEKIFYETMNDVKDTSNNSIEKISYSVKMDASISTGLIKSDSVTLSKENEINKVQLKSDSVLNSFAQYYEKQKLKMDSLTKSIAIFKTKLDNMKSIAQKDLSSVRQKIYKANNEKQLQKLAIDNGIPFNKKTKMEERLSAINNFSIGRSVLNYTELTAQNITVSGVNIEYNPSYYAAFAVGKIDYRFRDFYNKNSRPNNQYLILGRFGFGDKDHKAIIFTFFNGKKSNSNYNYSDSVNNCVELMGYSAEAFYKKDENNFISAEFAKSTKLIVRNSNSEKQVSSLWKYNDHSNMGINFKGQTVFSETHTKLSGFYRKTGEKFQSFSLFSYNTNQTAWLAKLDQSFYKERITLTGIIRRNDFTNPFTDKTYKTSTIFKSVLLNVRFKKMPILNLGYYPGTQLYMADNKKIRESAYYILNGSVIYSYILKGLLYNSMAVYNKYTSEATDSGFVAYQGLNIYLSQSIRFSKLFLQGGYAYTRQSQLQYSTFEALGDFEIKKWLHISSGLKFNKIITGKAYWGETLQLRIEHKKIGGLQLQYEKNYLPTLTQDLSPVEIGRVGYFRRF